MDGSVDKVSESGEGENLHSLEIPNEKPHTDTEILKPMASPSAKSIKRRLEILQELYDTEKSYVSDLSVILDVFLKPIQERELLSKTDQYNIFANIQVIYNDVNVPLLREIETYHLDHNPSIGPIFMEQGDLFKFYAAYCSNQPFIPANLKRLQSHNQEFSQFMAQASRDPRCKLLDVESFLISPLQRLCRYPLLLKEFLKTTEPADPEYEDYQLALAKIQSIVTQVNNRVRKAENVAKLYEIADEVQIPSSLQFDLLDHNRRLISEGPANVNGKPVYAYLFNDVLFLCREKKNIREGHRVITLKLSVLNELELKEGEFKFELLEIGRQSYVISFESSLKLKKWKKAFQEALNECSSPEEKQLALAALQKIQESSSSGTPKKEKEKEKLSEKEKPEKSEKSDKTERMNLKRSKSRPFVGPSVKKIAERFETSNQKAGPNTSRIRKLTTAEKESRIFELEQLVDVLKLRIQESKLSLKQEQATRIKCEQKIISLEQRIQQLESNAPLNTRSRSGAVSTIPNSLGDTQIEVFNQIIAHLSAENIRIQTKLDKAKNQLKIQSTN